MIKEIPMTHLKLLCLGAALCATASQTQVASAGSAPEADASTAAIPAPVAFVYVSSTPKNSSNNEVIAYTANAEGKLTPVTGSPFQADIGSMAVTESHLFGANNHTPYIDAYQIEPSGALRYSTFTNYAQYNSDDCGSAESLLLDHTGSSLYVLEYNGNICANNSYQSFAVDKSNASLRNLGSGADGAWLDNGATFTGNNLYAYSASCLNNLYWEIFGFKRSSDGRLNQITINAPTPRAKSGDFFCPSLTAADPSGHVAISMQAVNGQEFTADGAAQLATYTVGNTGNLSTTSTPENMPTTEVGIVNDINMSTSGKLLAVGGTAGLQVFHFNGASPITRYTGLLTRDPITKIHWDSSNHLYAISQPAGKLFVFTVTPISYSHAPGSPYSISSPQALAVQIR